MYKKLKQEIAGSRQRAQNVLLTQIQAKYDREQPMLKTRCQLSGFNLAEEEKPLRSLEEEVARRTETIDAVAAYALFEGDMHATVT
ncbi:hypothetical protein APSETT444_010742 [Aspergillus pseudonomiae]